MQLTVQIESQKCDFFFFSCLRYLSELTKKVFRIIGCVLEGKESDLIPVICPCVAPLSVRVSPQVEVKALGSAVEFTCSASGGPEITLEWLKEGGSLPHNHHIKDGVLRWAPVSRRMHARCFPVHFPLFSPRFNVYTGCEGITRIVCYVTVNRNAHAD